MFDAFLEGYIQLTSKNLPALALGNPVGKGS